MLSAASVALYSIAAVPIVWPAILMTSVWRNISCSTIAFARLPFKLLFPPPV